MVKGSQLTPPNAPIALLGSPQELLIELHSWLPAAAPGLCAGLAGTGPAPPAAFSHHSWVKMHRVSLHSPKTQMAQQKLPMCPIPLHSSCLSEPYPHQQCQSILCSKPKKVKFCRVDPVKSFLQCFSFTPCIQNCTQLAQMYS